jgi:hypothetical protein
MSNINDFKGFDFDDAFQINGSLEVQSERYDDLTYITIDNFFKYPERVVDILKLFPINDRSKFYNHFSGKSRLIRPAGDQQFLPNSYFQRLSYTLYKLLSEHDYVPYDFSMVEDFSKLGDQLSQFVYYTNIFYPNMPNYDNNYLPHFDQSSFAFNIYLSEEDIGGGTSFYNLLNEEKKYPCINSITSIDDFDEKLTIQRNLNDMNTMNENSPKNYVSFEKNDLFEKYHTIPFEFNKLVLYAGHYWHNADYDSTKENNLRYSLCATYSPGLTNEVF